MNYCQSLINGIDKLNEFVGRFASWLILCLIILIGYDVMMRYVFHQGSIALQELEWHLFALIFLLGAAYTLKHDGHVRVDILYQSRFMTPSKQALINILGSVMFLMPFCLLVLMTGWSFVENAFYYNESSPDPGGLPYRFILKGSILVAFSLLLLQGISEFLKNLMVLLAHKENA
jgi:TRAP-type mannitol/chloroaromatic compound transport system permease small subunit